MRLLWAILIAAGVSAPGCKSTGKQTPFTPTGRERGDAPFWADRDNPSTFAPSNKNDPLLPAAKSESEGMLAGRVIDASGRAAPNTFIQVTLIDASNPGGPAKPVGVTSDGQGYFLIPGLRAGRTYELSARAEEAGKVMGGVVQSVPPNTRIVLPVREGNVSSITPPPQPHAGNVGPFANPDKEKPKQSEAPATNLPQPDPVNDPLAPGNKDQSWQPGGNPPASRNNGSYSAPPQPSRFNSNPPRLENIAEDPNRQRDPKVNIPNGPPRSAPDTRNRSNPPPPQPITGPESSLGPNPMRDGEPRINFSLYDLRGDTWQFKNAHGRLVLLDFWKTTCGPCIRAMPEMKELARVYGASGLEVVGVACEDSGSFDERAKAVSNVSYRQGLNYRVLLEGERREVQRQFGVQAFPTMVLLDRQGNVLWRGTGASAENMQQLEAAVKRGLVRR